MAETMLKITDLVSSYGNIKALKGISMEIQKGEIVSPFLCGDSARRAAG